MGSLEKFFGNAALKVLKGFVLERNLNPDEIDHSSVNNILVVLRHQMGDMLAATPMLRSLKAFYPAAKLVLVTKKSTRYDEIFSGVNSIADEVYKYEHGFENFVNLVKELRLIKPELAVIPSTVVFSSTNHLFGYYSYARIRAGVKSMDYEENRVSYLLNIKKDFAWSVKKVHQIERNLDIIRQLNITPAYSKIKINISKEDNELAEKFFRENSVDISKPLIGFHPGAGKKENVWPAEKFAELSYRLNKQSGAQIFISEGPDDKKYVQDMIKVLKEKYGLEKYIIHNGLLMRNLALLNLCRLFVSNDTGIMHLASGLVIPAVGLFGPSKAYEWGPLGENKVSVQSVSSKISDIDIESVFEQCCKLLI